MADQKKFLDYEGVKHLWSKINMQDYPNNETLMAVINAIDETKADKTDIVQSDWDQSDETAIDYIKNKPLEETEDDAMKMLAEMGIIDPVTDEEGNVFTDESGNILTI